MTDFEDDLRYWGLTHTQAARHRARVSTYWACIACHHRDRTQRLARLAILLTAAGIALAVWALLPG